MKDAIIQEVLFRIDALSNETFIAHASLRLPEALKLAGPVVVTVASNVRYEEEGNKRKKIEGELFSTLRACFITRESRKNLIYEAN